MAQKNDGAKAQDEFKEQHPEAVRLYDYRSSMGVIPVQPGDYVIPKFIVECKSTIHSHFRKSNFDQKQLAVQRSYDSKGSPVFYYLRFLNVKGVKSWYVPLSVVWDFFYTKGKGKLTMEEIKKVGREEL